jgi:hypothetical protein
MENHDESALSEITILPDGRVYAFGITRPIDELLQGLQTREAALHHAARTRAEGARQHRTDSANPEAEAQ